MCRSPNSSANHGLADGTRSVPATFVGHVLIHLDSLFCDAFAQAIHHKSPSPTLISSSLLPITDLDEDLLHRLQRFVRFGLEPVRDARRIGRCVRADEDELTRLPTRLDAEVADFERVQPMDGRLPCERGGGHFVGRNSGRSISIQFALSLKARWSGSSEGFARCLLNVSTTRCAGHVAACGGQLIAPG